jgi:RHS repeat-associated protein
MVLGFPGRVGRRQLIIRSLSRAYRKGFLILGRYRGSFEFVGANLTYPANVIYMEPKRNRNLTVADSNKKRNYNEEGRLTPKTGGCYQLEYTLKDHLGNARITFADVNVNGSINAACEILQEETYYPFGLQKSGLNTSIADVENKYQYNGKEFNDELGLNMFDYGARWYMADLGRWGAIDPMIETYPSFSPYNYVLNNPMIFY